MTEKTRKVRAPLASVPLSYPTYAGTLARVVAAAARQLDLNLSWLTH